MSHDGQLDLAYFWSSLLTIALPVVVFVALGVLTVRGYLRRRDPDGGGDPKAIERGTRNGERGTEGGTSVPRSDFRVPR